MTADLWRALSVTGVAADLSDHVRLRLTGPDAIRYLNGQVTQDVGKLQPGHALAACVTNHKGKLEAYVHLTSSSSGDLYISAPGDLRDFLPLRLEKYLIADNCVLENLTESTSLVHVIAPLERLIPLLTEGEIPATLPRFGPSGFDLWITPDRLAFWLGEFPCLTPDDQSTLEVIHAIPAWGHELTPDLLPPEAGLDATAIDYHKGCYIGQEVISRLRSVGRVNRRLTGLLQTAGPPVECGYSVRAGTGVGNCNPTNPPPPLGTISRSARHPLTGQWHALAFLHRTTPEGPLICGPGDDAATAVVQVRKSLDD